MLVSGSPLEPGCQLGSAKSASGRKACRLAGGLSYRASTSCKVLVANPSIWQDGHTVGTL